MIDDDIQLPNFRTVRMKLIDIDPIRRSQQNVKVFICPLGVSVFAEGYGAADGTVAPVFVTQRNGELVLFAWADINRKEFTHEISLSKAREANRRQQKADTC